MECHCVLTGQATSEPPEEGAKRRQDQIKEWEDQRKRKRKRRESMTSPASQGKAGVACPRPPPSRKGYPPVPTFSWSVRVSSRSEAISGRTCWRSTCP